MSNADVILRKLRHLRREVRHVTRALRTDETFQHAVIRTPEISAKQILNRALKDTKP